MKHWLLYIISITIAGLCYSCSGSEDLPGSDDNDTNNSEGIVIRLGISSRADDNTIGGGDNENIANLKVWMIKEDNTASFYQEIKDPKFDANGVYNFEMKVSILNTGKYNFYVLANSDNISGIAFDKNTTVSELKTAYFNSISGGTGTVAIPMYGEYHSINISNTILNYYVTVPIERVLAKLELYMARKNHENDLVITEAKLTSVPEKGFIVPQSLAGLSYNKTLDTGVVQTDITGSTNDFEIRERFTSVTLPSPFLLENPDGCLNEDISLSGNNNGYQLHLKYTLGQDECEKTIYLTSIKRNTIYKVYCLVADNEAETKLTLIPQEWDIHEEEYDFTDVATYTVNGWVEGSYNDKNGNEILLKNRGEAAYIEFKIDAPKGGTWKAVLTNEDDFVFNGATDGDNGTNTTIKLGVQAKDPLSEIKHETELRVFVISGGKSFELDMVNGKNTAGQEVNRYTIIQSL